MKIIESYLSQSELSILKNLIGKEVYQIFSPFIDVGTIENTMKSSGFSLAVHGKNYFIIIEDSYRETPFLMEYHKIKITKSKMPSKDLNYKKGKGLKGCSSISITPASTIIQILIYEMEDKHEYVNEEYFSKKFKRKITKNDYDEIVKYDYLIVFQLKDGRTFGINVKTGISEFVSMSIDLKTLLKWKKNGKLRISINENKA